ncbi:amino acid ABC transporter substrate-binding protein (PAAT family) [Stackebrandtia endophytica]|uniref:Amino acid ABC transporter substrate-binding protein (PAAT family) n=1 Tax=Stackebrandtia endophytica TaxID=1496996 RepID=A0A543B392_9ACTN|nr:glutamate ABC transporter substrate-binding protein [Stackebrandtia endophytica]TQL79308.1 amino acid ABC transporter substrate-binding protein (PAAT family) [Stackebrandtia endophytica]
MRMIRKAALVGVAVAALALSACSGEASKQQEAEDQLQEEVGAYSMTQATEFPEGLIADIKERGKLVVGSKFDQPLIGLKNSATNKIEGHDAEIARLLTQRIFGEVIEEGENANLEFIETTSQNRETYINDGTVDVVIASYSMYPERLDSFDFAGPYFYTGQNVMVSADDEEITSVDDLAGKNVCIAEGSGSIGNMEERNPDANIGTLKDYAACAESLENGTHDAVSTDSTILYGFVQGKPDAFKVLDESNIFSDEPYGIAMKFGETEARQFMNAMIQESYDNGDWAKAFELTYGSAGMAMPETPAINDYEAK